MITRATIDRFENENAILIADDKKSIIIPKDKLPKNSKEGSILKILVYNDIEAGDEKKELAKNILNELLDAEEERT